MERSCPLCERPVLDRELAYFDAGALVHLSCGRASSQTAELVATLLRSAPDQRSCHGCLSRLMELPHEEVRKATAALRMADGFVFELGAECDYCGTTRVTISFRS
jgi:hypothetical protein